jgi:peptidyl-prolyl cis-trans isomerase C
MAVVLVAGCSKGDADNKDIAAEVAGEKITTAELQTELKGAGVKNVEDPRIQRAALEELIARKLLAKAARAEKLDKSAEVLAAKAAAEEAFDANLDRRATVAKVAEPTPAEGAGPPRDVRPAHGLPARPAAGSGAARSDAAGGP